MDNINQVWANELNNINKLVDENHLL